MDKSAIKNFAVEARKILINSAITEAGFYGITKDCCKNPIQKSRDFEVYETVAGTENRIFGDDIKRRANLVQAIETMGFEQVIEETAYTWFNRIIAIRFMEVNNYLPTRVRVLSSETGCGTPDIISQVDTVELNLSTAELEKIQKAKRENRYDDAFRILFIKQCNELNAILPELFEKTNDYMELLLKISYTSDGVIRMLVDSIPEENFNVEAEGQVEIIGWMYQYYNTELNELVYDGNMAKGKIEKNLIPAATQLFTPDWPIKYMVDNSLGKLYSETKDSTIIDKLSYYLKEQSLYKKFECKNVDEIKFLDPCMGSGHILVYAFDVFMQLYLNEGYSERDAAISILQNNLYGTDIDRRAFQLTYFALFMKGRQYNRLIFRYVKELNVFSYEDSKLDMNVCEYMAEKTENKEKSLKQLTLLNNLFKDGKTLGSILIDNSELDIDFLYQIINKQEINEQVLLQDLMVESTCHQIKTLLKMAKIIRMRFDIIVTNPPYLGDTRYNSTLYNYVEKNYDNVRTDLSMVMLVKCYKNWAKKNGLIAFITPTSWLSLKSFETLRKDIILNYWISSLVDFGTELFDGKIGHNPITAWVVCNGISDAETTNIRLVDYCYSLRIRKQEEYFNSKNYYKSEQKEFLSIPGIPIAYWLSDRKCKLFEGAKLLGDVSFPRQGLATADNNKFLRLWWEVNPDSIDFNCKNEGDAINSKSKWFPHNKGGTYRKWYGNRDYVINWENNGYELKNFKKSVLRNPDLYFHNSIGYSDVTSGDYSARFYGTGFVFDSTGPSFFYDGVEYNNFYLLGILNSIVTKDILKLFCPSLHYTQSGVAKIPIRKNEVSYEMITNLAKENVEIVRRDWNYYETSWDFKTNIFVERRGYSKNIDDIWHSIKKENEEQRKKLKENEERINTLLIDLYGLNGELDGKVDENTLSIRLSDEKAFIEEFVSFCVGVILGRFSVNEIDFNSNSIISITEFDTKENDIFTKFSELISKLFGYESLDHNLLYIAQTIGFRGTDIRDMYINYFSKDFYQYHCKQYSRVNSGKRPIYWLFDSGNQNGFKCLLYVHKYTTESIGKIRSDYLLKVQNIIENALKNAEYAINSSSSAVDKAKKKKKRDKYIKQLTEIRTYYPALSHVALKKIEINLDDGIRTNYEKFQKIEVSIEGTRKKSVNLLASI